MVDMRRYDVDVTTTVNPDDILDSAAVAVLLGVTPRTVRDYAYRGELPEPDLRVARTPCWFRQTIEAWAVRRPRSDIVGFRDGSPIRRGSGDE